MEYDERKILKHLGRSGPEMRVLVKSVGLLNFRPEVRRTPFESLVRAIAHQQIHGAAAKSILKRFVDLFPGDRFPSPEAVLRKRSSTLRKAGFSESKVLAIRDIASKTISGVIPSAREISSLSDDEIIERLTEARGVGRWTAEMLLIFQLGRLDVFPADDFGVRSGYHATYEVAQELRAQELRIFAERWMPYRTYAALYFWRAADRNKKN